jgi:hypothetical protein
MMNSMKIRFGLMFCLLLMNPFSVNASAITQPPIESEASMVAASSGNCPALPQPTGNIVTVATVDELQSAVANLESGTTIMVADGVYDLTNTLVIDGGLSDVAIRGASGDRQAVVLRGQGMANADYGNTPHGFLIRNSNSVTIADLTIKDFYYHNVQIQGEQNAQATHLYNLRLIDAGEQLVKVSTAGPPGPYADDGIVECSYLGYSDRARSWYTNGVDVLAGAGWIIRDNVFENIRAPEGELAGPTVLMWRNSIDTVVERNLFIECDRAIAFGLSTPDPDSARDGNSTYDHQGGIIRNNIIYREGSGDIGITVNYARDYKIYHNTVILNNTFPYGAIEYRFSASNGGISYNLTDAPIWQRDGASGTLTGNITNAALDWFVDPNNYDLHLNATATQAIDTAAGLADVVDDFDGETRPIGDLPDIGADEFGEPGPTPTFQDVPLDHWAYEYIEALYQEGYIAGCSLDPLLYCPENIMTRAESAVFIERGINNADYLPPDPTQQIFDDVPLTEWFAKWASQLWEDGYTSGCGTDPLIYCPLQEHTIAEGCVFYLRMMKGAEYEPQEATGIFTDVPLEAWYARWVEDAYAEGILLPCQTEPDLMACPLDGLERAMGAYMMVQAKGLQIP